MAPVSKASLASSRSKIITLSLSKDQLVKFPHESSSSADPASPASSNVDSTAQPTAGVNTPDTAAGTNVNGSDPLAAASALDLKNAPGIKPTLKRNASQLTVDGVPKPRGKPGPKKKMKVDGPNGTLVPVNAPKLNPKASAGAINANLRALDRSGAPCRRWQRAPFQIKTFTGAVWMSGSTWAAPAKPKAVVDEDGNPVNGNNSASSNTPSDAVKLNRDSSAVASEKSQNGDVSILPPMVAMSSPAPVAVS